ncbi:MAG: macro domain-containing protein [Lachnospiraceae bacterium]|nr:macro domain-containing protein [Lachnospiraceae bacterium]
MRKRKNCVPVIKKSLELALENDVKTIAFPLIGTGGFAYPKEEGLRPEVYVSWG